MNRARLLCALVLAVLPLGACGGTPTAVSPVAATQASTGPSGTPSSSAPASAAPSTAPTGKAPGAPAALKPGSLAGKIIAVDPGHNGRVASDPAVTGKLHNAISEWKPCETTGTQTNAGYTEAAFNLDVALRLTAILRAAGAKVVLTRTDNNGVGPCFDERAWIGNNAHANVAISIHADGGPASGHGFHVLEPVNVGGPSTAILVPSRRLALDIRDAYRSVTGLPPANYIGTNGINPRKDMGGLNLSTVPKVLLECGNMRNAGDAAKLSSAAFRQKEAQGIAVGLAAFLAGK